MGKKNFTIKGNFQPLGFRSPRWQIAKYFSDKIKYVFRRESYDEMKRVKREEEKLNELQRLRSEEGKVK